MERVQRRERRSPTAPPSKYDASWMPRVAKWLCQRGATMGELANAFGVCNATLYNWLNEHQELHEAVQVNVDVFNPRVERALAERALGFFVTMSEEVRNEAGKVVIPARRQYYPPDPTSMIFFLKNRMKEKYRDVHRIENDVRVLKTSDECMIQIRKDIEELRALGYEPKLIEGEVLPPRKGNGSNGQGA